MPNYPAEVFGWPVDSNDAEALDHRSRYWCPFVGEACSKKSRLIDYPFGVCSAFHSGKLIALCPKRFLQNNVIFNDIADKHFGARENLIVLPEVALPDDSGTCDFVMLKHETMSTKVLDYAVIELQTADTSGTGQLVQALRDRMEGIDVTKRSYGFGVNFANIWKRTLIQMIGKGLVMEHWGRKIYWVVQEPIYADLLARYSLGGLEFDTKKNTVFAVYDLRRQGDVNELYQTRRDSSKIDHVLNSIERMPLPDESGFVAAIQRKVRQGRGFEIRPRDLRP